MFKFIESESTESCRIWSYRKISFDCSEIRKICECGSLRRSNHPLKKLKAAPGWRLARLSKNKRLLIKVTNGNSASVAIALWRKDLDRVSDQIASHLYHFDGGAL